MADTEAERNRKYFHPALKHFLLATVLVAVLVALLAGCDQHPTSTDHAARLSPPTATVISGNVYLDLKLGFHLTMPVGWQAISYPGRQRPSNNTLLRLHEPTPTQATITIG